MLTGKRRSHQLQGVGKQKLCVLRLGVDQGQLQIVKVCPYEGEIDRLIHSNDDYLSIKGCAGRNKAVTWSACDTCVEFVIIRSPLSQHPKTQKGPPGACP